MSMELNNPICSTSGTVSVRGATECVASEGMQPHPPRHVAVRDLQVAVDAGVPTGSREAVGPIVRVLAGHAGAGASTLAAALADAADGSVDPSAPSTVIRLIDAASPAWSGLAGASERDLAVREGWRRGSRGRRVLVDRLHLCAAGPCEVPPMLAMSPGAEAELTVVDVGWSVRELLAAPSSWLASRRPDVTVLVSRSTTSELAQTEYALRTLDLDSVVVAIVGGRRRPRSDLAGAHHLRRLDAAGAVVTIPQLPARVVREITPTASATPLRMAARSLLEPVLDHASNTRTDPEHDDNAMPALVGPGPGREDS